MVKNILKHFDILTKIDFSMKLKHSGLHFQEVSFLVEVIFKSQIPKM